MKSIQINKVLKIDTFYNLFTERDQQYLKEDPVARIEDATDRVVSVVLKNKVKALEIPGISFTSKSEYLHPDMINQKLKNKELEAKKKWDDSLKSMIETVAKARVDVEEGRKDNISIENLDICNNALISLLKEDVAPKLDSQEDERLRKNIGNIIVEVEVNIDNPSHEEAATFSILSTVFNNAISRLIEDEKKIKVEKCIDK